MKDANLVKAFKEAKINLRLGGCICWALEGCNKLSYDQIVLAKYIINQRMGFLGQALEEWLSNQIPNINFHSFELEGEMYLYRLRWLDALIAEFS